MPLNNEDPFGLYEDYGTESTGYQTSPPVSSFNEEDPFGLYQDYEPLPVEQPEPAQAIQYKKPEPLRTPEIAPYPEPERVQPVVEPQRKRGRVPTPEGILKAHEERGPFESPEYSVGKEIVGAGKSIGKQAIRFFPNVGQAITSGIGAVGAYEESKQKYQRKLIGAMLDKLGFGPEYVKGAETPTMTERFYKKQKEIGLKATKNIKDTLNKTDWLNLPKEKQGRLVENWQYLADPEWMSYNIGEAIQSLGLVAAGYFVGGPVGAGIAGGSMEGLGLFSDLMDQGVDQEKALAASTAFGVVTGILNKIGGISALEGGKGLLGRLKSGGVEALTEYLEEPFQAAFESIAKGDDLKTTILNVTESFKNIEVIPGAFFAGGGMSGVAAPETETDLFEEETPPPTAPSSAMADEMISAVKEQYLNDQISDEDMQFLYESGEFNEDQKQAILDMVREKKGAAEEETDFIDLEEPIREPVELGPPVEIQPPLELGRPIEEQAIELGPPIEEQPPEGPPPAGAGVIAPVVPPEGPAPGGAEVAAPIEQPLTPEEEAAYAERIREDTGLGVPEEGVELERPTPTGEYVEGEEGRVVQEGAGEGGPYMEQQPTEPARRKGEQVAPVTRTPEEATNFLNWVNMTGGLNLNDKSYKGTFRDMRFDIREGGKKVPRKGFPKGIWRTGGVGMDERVNQAIEAGWLPEGSTEDDFIQMLEDNPSKDLKYSEVGKGNMTVDTEAEEEYYKGVLSDLKEIEKYGYTTEEIERIERQLTAEKDEAFRSKIEPYSLSQEELTELFQPPEEVKRKIFALLEVPYNLLKEPSQPGVANFLKSRKDYILATKGINVDELTILKERPKPVKPKPSEAVTKEVVTKEEVKPAEPLTEPKAKKPAKKAKAKKPAKKPKIAPESIKVEKGAMVPGRVRLDKGGVKPFSEYREINKGPQKGKIQVTLTSGKKVKVRPEQIREYPKPEEKKYSISKAEKKAPAFYSALEKGISDLKQETATPDQWKGMINKLPVKSEELEWVGLEDWLKEQKGKVTKQDILDFVRANNVQVQEVVKGTEPGMWEVYSNAQSEFYETEEEAQMALEEWRIENRNEFLSDLETSINETTDDFGNPEYDVYIDGQLMFGGYDTEEEAQADLDEWIEEGLARQFNMVDIRYSEDAETPESTKYHQYQMPGGENYKELLLTLPDKMTVIYTEQNVIPIEPGSEDIANQPELFWYFRTPDNVLQISKKKYPTQQKALEHIIRDKAGFLSEEIAKTYRSSHWEEPNVLAHVRFNERTGPNGEKVLFIEEIQSDWGQEGRKKGYKNLTEKERDRLDELAQKDLLTQAESDEFGVLSKRNLSPVPDMPFKKSWPLTTFKRMVRYAAENDFDTIAWTPGEVQVERYDLSKQINKIYYSRNEDGTYDFEAEPVSGQAPIKKTNLSIDEVENFLGKEIAEKFESNVGLQAGTKEPTFESPGTLMGIDLKVGGEGMKGFYDKILPSMVNKFFNKPAWGKAKVGTVELDITTQLNAPNRRYEGPELTVSELSKELKSGKHNASVKQEFRNAIGRLGAGDTFQEVSNGFSISAARAIGGKIISGVKIQEVHSIPITNEMKEKALTEGMPLYSITTEQKKKLKGVTKQDIHKAFPGSRVTKATIKFKDKEISGQLISLPSGEKVLINFNDAIAYDINKMAQDRNITDNSLKKAEKTGELQVDGAFTPGNEISLIELTTTTDPGTLSHEKGHWLFKLLSKNERAELFKRYKTEEKAVEAFRKREGYTRNLWEKIQRVLGRIRDIFFGDTLKPMLEKVKAAPKETVEKAEKKYSISKKPKTEAEKRLESLLEKRKKPVNTFGASEHLDNDSRAREILDKNIKAFEYWILDKNLPIQRVQQKLKNLTDEMDVFLKETQRPKVTSYRIEDVWDTRVKPMLEFLAKNNISIGNLEEYAHAMHAPERNAIMRQVNAKRFIDSVISTLKGKQKTELQYQIADYLYPKEFYAAIDGIFKKYADNPKVNDIQKQWNDFIKKPSGMTDEQARKIIEKHKGNKQIEQARKLLSIINAERLMILKDAGQISEESYTHIKNRYKNYVPLYREGFDDTITGAGKGLQPAGRAIKTAMGSSRKVVNILSNSVSKLENAIVRAEKAKSARALYNLIKENPDPEFWSLKESTKSPNYDAAGNIKMYPDPMSSAPNEFRFMVDGKQYILEVNKNDIDAMRMLKTLKAQDTMSGPFMNSLSKVNRWLSQINTSWSPEFILSNFVRDIQTAGINIQDTGVKSKKLFTGAMQAIKAIHNVERGKPTGSELEKIYDRFKKAGGKIGWSDLHGSVTKLAKKLKTEFDIYAGKRPVYKAIKDFSEMVGNANTAVENGVRLHTFKLAIEQGMSDEKAAQIASDLTVDFTKKGAAGPVINSMFLFANAGIQGSYRIWRAAAKSPKVRKIMGGIVAAGFLNGLLNAGLGGEDDDGEDYFNKIDDFVRERNMIWMIPGTKGKYVKIPMPWGYNFFWNVGNEISRVFTKENYKAWVGASRLASTFLGAFNPIQSGTILQTLSPTIADPIVQAAENKNWFGGQLMPEKNKFEKVPTPDSQRYWKTASSPAKWVANKLNELTGGSKARKGKIDVSPETLDLLIDTAGGSALRFIKDVFDTPYKLMRKQEVDWFKTPFTRRIAGKKSEWADQRLYYENIEQILTAEKELNDYEGTEFYKQLEKDLALEKSLIPLAKSREKVLRKLRKNRTRYELSGDDKKLKEVKDRINKLYLDFNKKYYAKMKQKK